MELKRCVRCGKFYDTEVEVCQDCIIKDMADMGKLKSFLVDGYTSGISKTEIAESTGISARNLDRYLGYEEFNNIYLSDMADNKNKGKGKTEITV